MQSSRPTQSHVGLPFHERVCIRPLQVENTSYSDNRRPPTVLPCCALVLFDGVVGLEVFYSFQHVGTARAVVCIDIRHNA